MKNQSDLKESERERRGRERENYWVIKLLISLRSRPMSLLKNASQLAKKYLFMKICN